MTRRPNPKIDWFNVSVWTLIAIYSVAVLGLAGLGAAWLAGWVS